MSSCRLPALCEAATESPGSRLAEVKSRKKLVRRTDRDYSQQIRLAAQLAFLALNVWIGVQFYFWVRWAETAGQTRVVQRPAGVEGWLPIEGLMQLKYFVLTGQVPRIHPAGLFLFIAFLLISFLARKSFCSWLCPVGTLSEYLWKLGRYTFRRNVALPRWLDLPLRGMKYLLLGFFVYAVGTMSAPEIAAFLNAPYGMIVDVRMLNFFRFLDGVAALSLLGLIVASIFVQNFWCRYACPYGALMGLVAMSSPLRIRRNEPACIDCAKCAQACPSLLPVDKLVQIRSAECTGCMECVAVCPAANALVIAMPGVRKKTVPAWAIAAAIAAIFSSLTAYAKLSGHWNTQLPQQVYFELVSHAHEAQHP